MSSTLIRISQRSLVTSVAWLNRLQRLEDLDVFCGVTSIPHTISALTALSHLSVGRGPMMAERVEPVRSLFGTDLGS